MYKNEELIEYMYKLIDNCPEMYKKYLSNIQIEIDNDWPKLYIKIKDDKGTILIDTTMKYLSSDKYNESESLLFEHIAKNDGGWFPYRSFAKFIDIKIHEKLEEMEFNAMHWAIISLIDENFCNIFVIEENILDNFNFNKMKFDIKEVMKEFWAYRKIECNNNSYYCMVIAEI